MTLLDRTLGHAVDGTTTTAGAATSTLFTFTVPDGRSATVFYEVWGQDLAAAANVYVKVGAFVANAAGGQAYVQGSCGADQVYDPGPLGWSVAVDTSGQTVRVRVTGGAGVDIRWVGRATFMMGHATKALPSDVANLQCWLKADAGITESGGFASQWDDQSGNGRHATQATGGLQPAYNAAGGPNNKPYLAFDGHDDIMNVAGWGLAQPWTLYIVAKPVTDSVGHPNGTFFDGTGNGSSALYRRSATNATDMYAGAWLAGSAGSGAVAWARFACYFNGAGSTNRYNSGAPAAGNVGASNAGGIRLGAGGSWLYSDAYIAEVLVYSGALSTADDAAVQAYLIGKYTL